MVVFSYLKSLALILSFATKGNQRVITPPALPASPAGGLLYKRRK